MFLDSLVNLSVELVLKGFSALTVMAAAATSLVAVAIPVVADFSLIIAAVFAPLCLAIYPLSRTWAMSCFNTAVHAVMTGVGVAIFLQILLGKDGVLKAAIDATTVNMKASGENFMPILGGMLGLCVVYALAIIVLLAIPHIVQSIFGGFALNAAMPAAGAVMAGAKAGGRMSAAAAVGGGKAGAMGVSMAASGMGKAMSSGAAQSVLNSASRVISNVTGGGGKGARAAPSTPAGGATRATNSAAGGAPKTGGNSYRPAGQNRGGQPAAQPPKPPAQGNR